MSEAVNKSPTMVQRRALLTPRAVCGESSGSDGGAIGLLMLGAAGDFQPDVIRAAQEAHALYSIERGKTPRKQKWSERQDLNLRRLAPKASALARLSYAPTRWNAIIHNGRTAQRFFYRPAPVLNENKGRKRPANAPSDCIRPPVTPQTIPSS